MTTHTSETKKSVLTANDVVYSITELNRIVQNLLEDAFLPLNVEGEISNFACPSSGHWYFSLKDKNAQVRCALFQAKHRYKNLQLKNGMQVLVRAKISLYPARGEFQLIIDQIELAGEGALRKAFEQLKAKLAAEGLFENRHKKPLPKFPKTIGIITSETGAALRDICVILKRRFASINLIIYPSLVQGKSAATQIAAQIQCANQRQECDVLILARGGGSIEDLWCFNEENVARAIFAGQIPLISAIGHETDFTIADFVADHRAATPSMAAQLASPDMQEYRLFLAKTQQRLTNAITRLINHYQQQLENLSKRLRHPRQRLQDNTQRLDDLTQRLILNMRAQLNIRQQKLLGISRTLHAVSPLASLARGYAVIKNVYTSQIIRDIHDVSIGERIIAEITNGKLLCQIENILD